MSHFSKPKRSVPARSARSSSRARVPAWVEEEVRSNYARANEAGRRAAKLEPRATRVRYVAVIDALWIELTNGTELTLPVKLIPSLKRVAPKDIRSVEVLGRGGGLHWEALDLDLSVPALFSSIFPGTTWLAELGRVGGKRTSAAKTVAARKNGTKGGRPRIPPRAAP